MVYLIRLTNGDSFIAEVSERYESPVSGASIDCVNPMSFDSKEGIWDIFQDDRDYDFSEYATNIHNVLIDRITIPITSILYTAVPPLAVAVQYELLVKKGSQKTDGD